VAAGRTTAWLITSLVLDNVMKMINILQNFSGWMRIPNVWILDNYEFTVNCLIGNMHYNVCLATYSFVFLNWYSVTEKCGEAMYKVNYMVVVAEAL
jgi:hypothetical protein